MAGRCLGKRAAATRDKATRDVATSSPTHQPGRPGAGTSTRSDEPTEAAPGSGLTQTDPSWLAEATRFPSGENETDHTVFKVLKGTTPEVKS